MKNKVQIADNGENKDTLTAKEERFCYEYCIDLNATKAAIRAGYSPRSARSIGCENLTKPYIKRKIQENQIDLAQTAGITALKIIKELELIAFSNIGNLRKDWNNMKDFESLTDGEKASIQEVSTTTGKYGNSLKIKFYNKQVSLNALADILGIKAPTKTEITGPGGKDLKIFIEMIDTPAQVDPEYIKKEY